MEKTFLKTRSMSDIAISVSTLVIGCICTLAPVSETLNIFGVFAIIAGFILMLTLKSEYIDPRTGIRYKKKIFNFAREEKENILKVLPNPDDLNDKEFSSGESLMLLLYHNKEKAYAQLLEYVPHQYVPCSKMYEYKSTPKLSER
ncbi:MAG: hypothetical protein Q4B21_05710 [Bacteroidia bacterium]|nr:hypothetical protein [Bacteroidia bacterium]